MTLHDLKILVLEDEPIIALAIEDLLLDGGARPILAETLAQAHSLIAGGDIDTAVLDVNVHGERSYSVADTLRRAGVPFIFATGYGATVHPPEYSDVKTIAKPYGFAEIEAALASAAEALTRE
jgi:DNA-binding response OmpR family regulator